MKITNRSPIFFVVFLWWAASLVYPIGPGAPDQRLAEIEKIVDTAVVSWQSGTDGSAWESYRLSQGIGEPGFHLKAPVRSRPVFSGVPVAGTPLILKITLYARGLCKVKVLLDGRKIDAFEIDASSGTGKEAEREIIVTDSIPTGDRKYRVQLDVQNLGFKPFRGESWPPRKKELKEEGLHFSVRSARLHCPGAGGTAEAVKNWLASMKIAHTLLNPDFRRFTFTGKPYRIEDRRRTPRKRLQKLNRTLEKAISRFDIRALESGDTERLKASIRQSLEEAGELRTFAREFEVYLIGNAHIDVAWLWRIGETVRVARNTYDTVIKNMSEYPELHYAQSQALTYRWIEEKYPELFEKIKEKIKAGTWEVVGGMWVEPDCNLISGESWVRQILYGKKYFREKFGIDVRTGWNVDSFGYNWNMPQIYRKSGIDRFVTQKIWWNDTTVFPHYVFWWQGVDGTRLLSYFPPVGYTSRVRMSRVTDNITKYEATTGYKKSLILYGIGDHGGGPNREILDRVRGYRELPLAPRFIHSRAEDFLKSIERDLAGRIPVWNDELYLEYHRGTYTTQAETKKNNRRCEAMVSTAEKLAAIAGLLGEPYPAGELEAAWKGILTNQFHDILPGSSITPVYRDAAEGYAGIKTRINRVGENALREIAERIDTTPRNTGAGGAPVVVFNPLSWKRSDVVTLSYPAAPNGCRVRVLDHRGNEVPVEVKPGLDDRVIRLSFVAPAIPSLGYRVFYITEGEPRHPGDKLQVRRGKESIEVENRFHRVAVDRESGNFQGIYDKGLGKEFVEAGKEANILQVYEDRPENWDAWNIGYTGRMWELNRADAVRVKETSPVRVVIEVKKSFLGLSKSRYGPTEEFPSSFFTQHIILYRDLDRIDIETEADWWEDHMFLKAAFPVRVKSENAGYEIPFAAIRRTTKFDTLWEKARFEVPALKWVDLSDRECGISLLNDGKYGYDIHANVLKISLLRAPTWPDPLADRGKHTFVYSIYTHPGGWNRGDTVKRGYELNFPLLPLLTESHGGKLPPEFGFFEVESNGVVLDTVKRSEQGDGYILRLYESKGIPGKAAVRFFKGVEKIYETDLMEHIIKEMKGKGKKPGMGIALPFKKFEIKTLKIIFSDSRIGEKTNVVGPRESCS